MEVVSRLLRRRWGIVFLALTALAAFLDAKGIASLVGAALEAPPHRLAPFVPAEDPTSPHATSADAILRRNPFDSTPRPDDVVASDEPPSCDDYRPRILVASDDPEWSLASLVAPGSSKPLLRRRGGAVGDREIAFVGVDRVWLRSASGAICQARLWRAPAAASSAVEVKPPPRFDPAIARGIVRVGPRELRIDRGVVDRILEGYAELMKGTIVTPDKENGRTVGVRLFGIRPDSVLGVLGLENGDRLMSINGYDLTDPTAALQAMAYLRTAPRIEAVIVRAGKQTSIVYEIP